MIKKFVLSILCLGFLLVGILAFTRASTSKQGNELSASQEQPAVPEHVIYRQLFHDIVALNERADELGRQGMNAPSLRNVYKRRADLSEDQARVLYEIALDCEHQVNQQDAKAKVIIDNFKSRYPGGRVPSGEIPGPPSPELVSMQAERNAIILRARDRLREAFGDEEFKRLKEFVENRIAPNVRPVANNQLTPILPSEGH